MTEDSTTAAMLTDEQIANGRAFLAAFDEAFFGVDEEDAEDDDTITYVIAERDPVEIERLAAARAYAKAHAIYIPPGL